jgi:hypothetical protein
VIGAGIPRINPLTGGFRGGIETNYGSFSIPRNQEIMFDINRSVESDEEEDTNRYSSDRYDDDKRPARSQSQYPSKTNK